MAPKQSPEELMKLQAAAKRMFALPVQANDLTETVVKSESDPPLQWATLRKPTDGNDAMIISLSQESDDVDVVPSSSAAEPCPDGYTPTECAGTPGGAMAHSAQQPLTPPFASDEAGQCF